ncbi:MAG TPA: YncE family protein [Usitatibacter sp.]|jgi:YVTN family beta-propeller protein|nr:YncE family protein [Usitatibacter sp.]
MRSLSLALAVLAVAVPLAAPAQSVVATVATGSTPRAVAVNAATNRIYVANEFSNAVTILDGASNAILGNVTVGSRPQYIAVNAATNKVYVSNGGDSSQTVIDAATLATVNLPSGGNGPFEVDTARNQVYMVRLGNNDEVTRIDGATNTWYTMATDSYTPMWASLNPNTNRLFVAHYSSGDVRIVDLDSASDFPPTKSVGVFGHPVSVAVNPATNKAYAVSEDLRGPITVIDGATQTGVSLTVPSGHALGPRSVAVNPATNKAYAAFSGEVAVIDGATNAVRFVPTVTAVAMAINPNTNRIYLANDSGALAIIDGNTNAVTTIPIPSGARSLAVNPNTNRIYVASDAGVTVVDGAGLATVGPVPPAAFNVQGLWWRSPAGSESGWGVNLTQQGSTLFATWFTYDAQGNGLWLVMSSGAATSTNSYSGTLYQTAGPAFNAAPFDPAKVTRTPVGTATFTFTDEFNGTFAYTVNGVSDSKPITRQVYDSRLPVCTLGGTTTAAPNYQALWWASPAGSESGWGLNITHQGDTLFATWFTYGPDGKGMWLVGSNLARTGNGVYAGTLYRTVGPPWNANPWNPAMVATSPVGNATLTFTDASTATFAYTVNGISQAKTLVRQVFASPETACH